MMLYDYARSRQRPDIVVLADALTKGNTMEKLNFLNVEVLKYGRDKSKGSGWVLLAAELTADIMTALGWAEAPECYTGGSLEGDFNAQVADFVPADKALTGHRFELNAARFHSFKTVRLENKGTRGVGHRTELRFRLVFADPEGCSKLDRYALVSKSSLRVKYEKPAVQEPLPGQEDGTDTGCVACNNGQEFMDDAKKKHINGVKCTRRPVQEPLPAEAVQ